MAVDAAASLARRVVDFDQYLARASSRDRRSPGGPLLQLRVSGRGSPPISRSLSAVLACAAVAEQAFARQRDLANFLLYYAASAPRRTWGNLMTCAAGRGPTTRTSRARRTVSTITRRTATATSGFGSWFAAHLKKADRCPACERQRSRPRAVARICAFSRRPFLTWSA